MSRAGDKHRAQIIVSFSKCNKCISNNLMDSAITIAISGMYMHNSLFYLFLEIMDSISNDHMKIVLRE